MVQHFELSKFTYYHNPKSHMGSSHMSRCIDKKEASVSFWLPRLSIIMIHACFFFVACQTNANCLYKITLNWGWDRKFIENTSCVPQWCTPYKFQKVNIKNNIVPAFSDRRPLDANGLTFVWLYKQAARLLVCTVLALETVLCACKHTTMTTAQESTTPRQLLSSKHCPWLSRLTEHLSFAADGRTKRFHWGTSWLHRHIVTAMQIEIWWFKFFMHCFLFRRGHNWLVECLSDWLHIIIWLIKSLDPSCCRSKLLFVSVATLWVYSSAKLQDVPSNMAVILSFKDSTSCTLHNTVKRATENCQKD